MTLYVLPDAELWATGYLRDALAAEGLDDVYVSNEVPDPRRARMVVATRNGGIGDRIVDRPRMTVRVFDEDPDTIADLVAVVRALMMRALGNGPVRKVAENAGPVEIPDAQAQRLMTYDLTLRGGPLS